MEERGEVDVSRPIGAYLAEVAKSSLAGASVRDILDMATGLDCADDYEDRDSCYYRYSMAIGDGFRTADAPDNPYDFVASLNASRHAPASERFSYSGLNTFVLAWLVGKLTGMPFQDALSKEVWFHIGAESNAACIAPRDGVAVTHGGFMARLRDMARFGLLFTPSYGNVSERRIIIMRQTRRGDMVVPRRTVKKLCFNTLREKRTQSRSAWALRPIFLRTQSATSPSQDMSFTTATWDNGVHVLRRYPIKAKGRRRQRAIRPIGSRTWKVAA